jgi:hypothetical protein
MLNGQVADKADEKRESVQPNHDIAVATVHALIFLRLLLSSF